ncbi:MAG: Trx7/PDZ domain-containing (seleno)protein [Zavarzinella sp.]
MIRYLLLFAAGFLATSTLSAQTRDEKVKNDRAKFAQNDLWLYSDFPKAIEQAKESGKPIMVVLRCIPCEECVKLDDELLEQDAELQALLKKFVCVRIISTNSLDLNVFQYDTDQSFAVFFLNADKTIYGRFGTRSHRTNWVGDVSIDGLKKAMNGALNLHQNFATVRPSLLAKTGPKPMYPTPVQFPNLKGKYEATINYNNQVARSCIHCHQIGEAVRDTYRVRKQAIPEELLFPYPHPKMFGLVMDPKEKATIKAVEDAPGKGLITGFQAGDEILTLNGQPLLSLADIQWVLHHIPASGGKLTAVVKRGNKPVTLESTLPSGWRRQGDISWRVSSWGLKRMTTGGLSLEATPDDVRQRLKIPATNMALRVRAMGQYNEHAAAKRAGFQVGDIIVAFDGQNDLLREQDIFFYGATVKKAGEKVKVNILRNQRSMTLELPMQQ